MEYYFSDRSYNIIGMASTTLKDAIRIYDDLEAEDIDSGLSSFEGKIYFTDDKDGNIDVVTEMCQKGNYILYRNRLGKDRFFTIIETEKDRKENSISFYAEDGGLDLINEVVGPFESTTAQPASFYLEEFLKDSGFTIGLNEIVNLSRKLKWEGESSVTSRIRSVATQFDNAEISFSFEIEGMVVSEKKVNIHKKRGNETNETLTLGKEIDNIKTIESIENLATSLLPKGGTPEGENAVPIDLKGYVYDDGRFYVNKDGFIRDREARTIWNRFSTTPSDDTGFINKPFSYDTLSKSELLNRAIGKLKEISKPDQNFIVDIITLPDNVSLGDRINIVDERDDLNLSTRVLKLEIEEGINKCTALLGEFIIKQKTIGEKLQDIADNLKDNMKPGDTYYPSVAYADDSEGNGFSMSPDNKAYIAIIHQKNNSISSTNPKDYEGQWIHIKGLNGDRGEDGLPGKDGVGLKSTTITYAYNKSSLNPPTSGWTSDVPQTPPGDYLWTRTIWKYTDNKEETGYSVSRIGKDGNTGNDGIAGKDGVGLKSTSVDYASSSSGTIIPTSGWSLNIPEVPTGQFLWTRTIWTYTDNTNERGYSVSRMGLNGTNGKDGIAGKDGVGLKSTTIRYAASEDGITPPVIWYADIQPVPPGQFLWTQTTWSYTDDTKEVGYSVSKIGEDGMKGDDGVAGKDGVGIENTKIQYTASSDGSNLPTSGWTDQIPIVTPGKFLWTRTVWTYTDGTNETGYSISRIGEDGTDGIAGKDGFGLKSTSITYAGSTSGTTAPSGGWSNNVPAVPAGNYLWTKTTWVYTDNTNETGYTVSRIGKDGNTGKDGIAGKDGVGIKSTAITYVSSPSGTGTPTGGWTESIPTVPPGQYLWTRTIWTYSDNTTETGYSVARSGKDGNTGKDGIAGKDGKGITSTTITYGLSTTDTVEPTNYTSNVPTLAKGQYLWTKTVWKYTDATTETGYTKTYIAKDGNNGTNGVAGKDGVGISKTTITYAKSTNGTTAPTTGYTTTVPSTNPGDYLWTKTVWTYTDNTNETGYSVGKIGNTGAQGASAISYWITASNNIIGKSQTGVINPTNITFTGYSKTGTANSALYAGRFIIQTSTNGTSYTTRYTSSANQNAYTYTIPADTKFIKALFYQAGGTSVLLDEQTVPVVESAEGIQVGGRNLILNSYSLGMTGSDSRNGRSTFEEGVHIITPTNNGNVYNTGVRSSVELVKGEEYTLSFEISTNTNVGVYWYAVTGGGTNSGGTIQNTQGEWVRHEFTYTQTRNSFNGTFLFGFHSLIAGSEVKYKNLKLEKGNKATDWTPAPEDARTYKAWANSSDGTVDFTRVYPNENLLLESNQSVTTSTYDVKDYPLADDTLTATDDIVITLKGALGADRTGFRAYNSGGSYTIGQLTTLGNGIYQYKGKWNPTGGNSYLRIYQFNSTGTSSSTIEWIKLERGTTSTAYTTNTTDSLTGSVMQYIGFSPLDSNNPSEYQWIINPEYTKALSDEATNRALENINESLEDKVAREEYAKLEQLATEFAKSYEAFISEGGRYLEDAAALEDRFTQIFLELGANTLDLQFLNTYFRAGEEGLLIGSEDSQIKMLLTNNRLSFQEGVGANAKEIAYFGGQSFIINSGAIVQDFQIGEHKFTNIGGGRTIVQWVRK